jgi:hypothetical protein
MRRLRERQAAERSRPRLAPVDPADSLVLAVEETLAALKLGPEDAAVAAVALELARTIDGLADQAYALRRFGPLLMRVLGALHATPMSRAKAAAAR